MRNKLLKIAPLIALICFVLFSIDARADFGNFSGDMDFGGYDSGFGGFDSDFGSGSDDDDSLLFWIFYLIFSALPWPVKLVLVAILIIVFMFTKISNKLKPTVVTKSRPEGAKPTVSMINLKPIAQYSDLDSEFDIAEFTEKLSNLYVMMQNCWTDKDITPLRPYFTDAQFAQYDRQLQESIKNHETNHVDRIAVLSVDIKGFYQSGEKDHIIAELRTRITTYTTDDETGNVIRGSKTAEKFMTYEWELVRPTGTITRKEGAVATIACPNCGAPLDINKSAKCEYCDSIITLDDHDFVIYSIKGISQRTSGR